MWGVILLIVFAAGGVFGYGVIHYLESGKKDPAKSESVAAVPASAHEEKRLSPRPVDSPAPPQEDPVAAKKDQVRTVTTENPSPPETDHPLRPRREVEQPRPETEPPAEKDVPVKPPVVREKTPPKPKGDDDVSAELRPLIEQLKTGTTEEKLKAMQKLADLGGKAKPAAGALCEAAVAPNEKVSHAALEALEKVDAEIQGPVFTLLVDGKAVNHKESLKKLVEMGKKARPALPILYQRIKVCQEQLSSRRASWNQPTLIDVTNQLLQTVSKVAPEDPEAVKRIIDTGTFTTPGGIFMPNKGFTTDPPFRDTVVPLLGEIAEGQPERRKQIMPPLITVLKEAVQTCKSENEFSMLQGIQEVEKVGDALLKCGADAKETLKKEVIPQLKELQFHKSEAVRKRAKTMRQKIENAP